MTKAGRVDHGAATVHIPKHQIDTVLTQCLQAIMDALHAGDTIEVRGFGRFWLRRRPARAGRNPCTGDTVQMPAKAVPAQNAGTAFQALRHTGAAPAGDANHGAPHRGDGVAV